MRLYNLLKVTVMLCYTDTILARYPLGDMMDGTFRVVLRRYVWYLNLRTYCTMRG
jgi:hypothetical protein